MVAIDGKIIRRSKDESKGKRLSHVVSAWACDTSLVLGQLRVNEKTNEMKAIPELLEILCLKGCVVTIDAMGTQKEIAKKIVDKEADHILQVKGNQETLLEDISLYFKEELFQRSKKELEKESRYWKEISFDHGKMEIREYYVENEVECLLKNHPGWKGLKGGRCVHSNHNRKV